MKVVDRLLMIVVSFLFFFFTGRCGQVQVSSFRVVALDDGNDTVIDWTALDC